MMDRRPTQPRADEQSGQAQEHRDIVTWTKVVGVFTALLFVVSGVADFFIYEQWQTAANAQADTREQLRAVISPRGGSVLVINDKNGKPEINITANFQNIGGTRTSKYSGWISAHYFDSAPNNLDFTQPYDKLNVVPGDIPGNTLFFVGPVNISGDDAINLIAKKGVGLAWGHIDYSDLYNPEINHPVSFCVLISQQGEPGNTHLSVSPFRSDCNYSR